MKFDRFCLFNLKYLVSLPAPRDTICFSSLVLSRNVSTILSSAVVRIYVPLFINGNLGCQFSGQRYFANGSSRYPACTALIREEEASRSVFRIAVSLSVLSLLPGPARRAPLGFRMLLRFGMLGADMIALLRG